MFVVLCGRAVKIVDCKSIGINKNIFAARFKVVYTHSNRYVAWNVLAVFGGQIWRVSHFPAFLLLYWGVLWCWREWWSGDAVKWGIVKYFPTSTLPHFLTSPLPYFPIFSLSHFPTWPLFHIPTIPFYHFPTFRFSHFPTFPFFHFPTFPLPHSTTSPLL